MNPIPVNQDTHEPEPLSPSFLYMKDLETLRQQQEVLLAQNRLLRREVASLHQMTGVGSVNGLMKSIQRFQQKERDGSATPTDMDVLLSQAAEFLRRNYSSSICLVCNHESRK